MIPLQAKCIIIAMTKTEKNDTDEFFTLAMRLEIGKWNL